MRQIMIAERRLPLLGPVSQPLHIVPDELPRVFVIPDETMVSLNVLVQPDRVVIIAPQVPESINDIAWIKRESRDSAMFVGDRELPAEDSALKRLLKCFV